MANSWEFIDGVLEVQEEFGSWVARPEPTNPILGALHRRARENCQRYAAGEAWYTQLTPQGRLTTANFCSQYLEDQGWDAPTWPYDSVPLQGGQCNQSYQVIAFWDTADGGSGGPAIFELVGPVSGPFTGLAPNGNGNYSAWVLDGSGTPNYFGFGTSIFGNRMINVTATVTPFPSGVDNCGSQPSIPGVNPPPSLPPRDPSQDPTDSPGQPITFPVEPVTDPFGAPVELPPFVVPDFRVPSFGGGDSGGELFDPPEPGVPIDGNNEDGQGGEDIFPDPPGGGRWVGCCVTVSVDYSSSGRVNGDSSAPVFTRVVGNVRLILGEGSSDKEYDTPLQIRSETVCVWSPYPDLPIQGVYVNVQPGVTYTVTPYYQPKTPQEV